MNLMDNLLFDNDWYRILVFNFQGTDIEEINIPVLKLSTMYFG